MTEFIEELDKGAATLITFNHSDVWGYDWQFFKTSLAMVNEIQLQMFKHLSLSVCNGVNLAFSDANEKKKFMKDK